MFCLDIYVIYTYIYLASIEARKKVLDSPNLGFRWFWELPCMFWELKLGPLKSSKCFQPPSLQPWHGHFLPRNSTSCHHPCSSTSISVSPISHSSSCLCCLLYSSHTYMLTHECMHTDPFRQHSSLWSLAFSFWPFLKLAEETKVPQFTNHTAPPPAEMVCFSWCGDTPPGTLRQEGASGPERHLEEIFWTIPCRFRSL